MSAIPLLDVRDLTVEFSTRRGIVRAVQHVNISIAKGETVGIVGESGSGKSVTSYAVMRILDRAGRIAEGSVSFTGIDVKDASEKEMRELRGREISMIFQNPRAALNPIRKVGRQIEDVLRQHVQADLSQVTEKAVEILEQVRIARPRERYHAYPFELSGGMCQRVVIALALACRPQLLIADEPTTGLDVTTQKTVMELVVELTRQRGHVDDPDHARPRACRHLLRPRRGDGEGPRGRDRGLEDDLHRAHARLYPQADARDAAARRGAARPPAGGRSDARGALRAACPQRQERLCRAAAGGREAGEGISAQGRRQGLQQAVPARPGAGARGVPRRRRASASPSIAARASAWSGSPAAASRPPRPW